LISSWWRGKENQGRAGSGQPWNVWYTYDPLSNVSESPEVNVLSVQ
jgi:hypothetical protein